MKKSKIPVTQKQFEELRLFSSPANKRKKTSAERKLARTQYETILRLARNKTT